MKPRMRSRKPASIGSNQASPANSPSGLAAVVLSLSMAWSPPARQRRALVVESQPETTSPHFQPHPGRDRGLLRRANRTTMHLDLPRLFTATESHGTRIKERVASYGGTRMPLIVASGERMEAP